MSISFPAIVYRSPGQQRKPGGGTYNFDSVQTQEELDAKLAAGWFQSSADAIAAAGDNANGIQKPKPKWAIKPTKKKKSAKPLDWRERSKEVQAPAPDLEVESTPAEELELTSDDAAPTREELEAKATELGIRFDGRTKDKKLGQLIQDRLSEPTGE
jgi:hypothetical protein